MSNKEKYEWGYLIHEKDKDIVSDHSYTQESFRSLQLMTTVLLTLGSGLVSNNLIRSYMLQHSEAANIYATEVAATFSSLFGCAVIMIIIYALLLTALPILTSTKYVNVQNFEKSLVKIALENNSLEELLPWDSYGKKYGENRGYFEDIDYSYSKALELGLTEEANTILAVFKNKLPSYNSDKGIAYRKVLAASIQKIDAAIAKQEKLAREKKSEITMDKVMKEIEAKKPGLQISEGSYSWNPVEVVNMGDLR